jgi:hypothetical protein
MKRVGHDRLDRGTLTTCPTFAGQPNRISHSNPSGPTPPFLYQAQPYRVSCLPWA